VSGANALPLIKLANVSKRYGDQLVVDNLSFEVRHGEIVALLGKTGAGKSTVMNMLMGTIGCDEGRVLVGGVDPFREFRALKGRLSVSFQTDRLLPWRTALDNAALGLQILGRTRAVARQIARQWLVRVKLEGAEDKYVHELSGGMRQRVSLARALAVDPEIVLLDESFSQLDHVTSLTLRRDFSQIVRQLGKTCVFVTHRIDDALEMADRILVLAAPARLAIEEHISELQRRDVGFLGQAHARIARAMGGEDGE
jgi:NitT/TauT family transport system ATP-binding protein